MTWRRASALTSMVGISERLDIGSSNQRGNSGTRSRASAGEIRSSVWSVPRCLATDRACAASSKLFSPNPIVKVLTGRLLCACINATTNDESMPPDKKAPSGTSAVICRPTASRSRTSRPSTAAVSPMIETIGLGRRNDLRRIPIARNLRLALRAVHEKLSGLELVDAAVDAVRGRHVPPAHVGAKALPVDLRRPAIVGAQCLQLRAEHEQAAESRPVERLDADPIARQVQRSRLPIPRGEGEHAVEPLQRRRHTPMGAGLDQHLAVRLPAKHSSRGGQLEAQLGVVVDLAVVGQDEAPAGGEHRLPAGRREVEDRQAAGARAKSRPPDRPRRRNHPARGGAMTPPSPSRSPPGARRATYRVHQGILRCRTCAHNEPSTFRMPCDRLSIA